jgi:hypothetical protein
MFARSHGSETSDPPTGRRIQTLTASGRTAPGMPMIFHSTPSTNLLASTVSQAAQQAEDIARRVSVNLHKCSRHVTLAENVQREMRPYSLGQPAAMSTKRE